VHLDLNFLCRWTRRVEGRRNRTGVRNDRVRDQRDVVARSLEKRARGWNLLTVHEVTPDAWTSSFVAFDTRRGAAKHPVRDGNERAPT